MAGIESVLEEHGFLVIAVTGSSMRPMLRHRIDTVTIVPCKRQPQPGDILLFRDDSAGRRRYVLHRLIKAECGVYYLRGDNCIACETAAEKDVLGTLTAFTRKGRQHSAENWHSFGRIWTALYPLRLPVMLVRDRLLDIGRRIRRFISIWLPK